MDALRFFSPYWRTPSSPLSLSSPLGSSPLLSSLLSSRVLLFSARRAVFFPLLARPLLPLFRLSVWRSPPRACNSTRAWTPFRATNVSCDLHCCAHRAGRAPEEWVPRPWARSSGAPRSKHIPEEWVHSGPLHFSLQKPGPGPGGVGYPEVNIYYYFLSWGVHSSERGAPRAAAFFRASAFCAVFVLGV